ncbi:MAG: TetR family transcriptional regulator [Polyangiales bacterium]|nr:TetR family transcriptional regulator [Myxococcales bacterium]MCB9657678.1 TetR family transcriptional regulator [Sandaracinaceae bacterium]
MSTRAQKKLESRQALMDAVITLTAHGRSFDSLSLRQVTAEAGLVPTAFYRHFDDMEQLGVAVAEQVCRDLRPLIRDARREATTASDSAVRASVELFLSYVRQHEAAFQFLSHAYAGGRTAVFRAVQREVRTFVMDLADDLRLVPPFSGFPSEDVEMISNIVVQMVLSLTRDVLALPEGQATREAELAARGIREMRFILLGALHWNPAFGQVPLELLRPKP